MWSPDQERALKAIRRWLKERDRQVFRLFGYAGTGKTEIAAEIGRIAKSVHFAAFTGKAAHVLRQRGCESVSTIHRLIYDSRYDAERKRFTHSLKPQPTLRDLGLSVVDEASMVNAKIGRELLSFKRPTLASRFKST